MRPALLILAVACSSGCIYLLLEGFYAFALAVSFCAIALAHGWAFTGRIARAARAGDADECSDWSPPSPKEARNPGGNFLGRGRS